MAAKKPKKKRDVAPAEGERRAIGGYLPQYRLSASIILQELRNGRLTRLRVADPEAGRLDDLQVETNGRVDGYQVKWSESPLTFRVLVEPDGDAPPLIRQLADGWKILRGRFPALRTGVHLSTSARPSTADNYSVGQGVHLRSFSAFLHEAWGPLKAARELVLPVDGEWTAAFGALREASGLTEPEFIKFLSDLELETGLVLSSRPANPSADEEVHFEDLDRLTSELVNIVGDRARIVELARTDLLERIGWTARLEFKNRHELHVDLHHYEPIAATVDQVEAATRTLRGGYLILLGSPGSGKSSLLTQTLRQEDVRLIRYYAFVPGAANVGRGESANFLHDVTLAIEQDPRFRIGRGLSAFDRLHLLERLRRQLELLHADYVETGRKTVIMVDGLDHIPREDRPARSLLEDLPLPTEVPEGVLIVLGSQTETVLPPAVEAAVRVPERRIQMQALSRESMFAILSRNERTRGLESGLWERVAELTRGHPLALRYLLNQLEGLPGDSDIAEFLSSKTPLTAAIEDEYEGYWPGIAARPEFVRLLSRLARLRRPFNLSWVEEWGGEEPVLALQRELGHYFQRDHSGRWAFFHNSFRQFLIQRTAERTPGVVDEEKSRRIHRELADVCSREPAESPWRWEELYHRSEGQEWAWFDTHPTFGEIREQLFNFRPIEAIQRDLQLALRAVAIRQNPVALVRLTLALKELEQRAFHLENVSLIDPLLRLGERDLAAEHIRDGQELRISAAGALRLAVSLHRTGAREEGRELFELAQPLELLVDDRAIEVDQQEHLPQALVRWVEAALSMDLRTTDQVLEAVARVRLRTAHPDPHVDEAEITEAAQANLRLAAGRALARAARWDDFEKVIRSFVGRRYDWTFWILQDARECCEDSGDRERATEYHRRASERVGDIGDDLSSRLTLAEGYWNFHKDTAAIARCLSGHAPGPFTDTVREEEGFRPFEDRFRYARVIYLTGERRTPTELVPSATEPRNEGAVYVQRALFVLGRLAAEADLDQPRPWISLERDVLPLLRLFNVRGRQWLDWSGWLAAERGRGKFFALLVDVVALHGAECLEGLRGTLEQEWSDEGTRPHWPTDVRRPVILALARQGVPRVWVVEQLARLEETMLLGRDASGRAEELRAQADAWLEVREDARARKILREALRVSSGVGYRKDYQFDTWIRWLGRVLPLEPGRALERVSWFARATVSLRDTTEGKAGALAANTLLREASHWSPRRAITLFLWLFDNEGLWFAAAMEELLREALSAPGSGLRWASATLRHVLLPIATEGEPELAELLLRRSHEQGGATGVQRAATELLESVDIYAMPSTRYSWKKTIADVLGELGLSEPSVEVPASHGAERGESDPQFRYLRLRDEQRLSPEEVLSDAQSMERLRTLLEQESADSYFDWTPVLENVRARLSADELFELSELAANRRRGAALLAGLSRELLARGDRERAWQVGIKALEQSSDFGWSRWSDGGTRLMAFQALSAISPDRTHPMVFQQLAEDGGGRAESLEEVLPLLSSDPPLKELWQEIETYCRGMFPEQTLPESRPELPPSVDDDTPSRALGDLASVLLVHPVPLLRQCARRLCIELLDSGDTVIEDLLKTALRSGDAHQEAALVVISAGRHSRRTAARAFLPEIRACAVSPQWLVRKFAIQLLVAEGEDPPTAPQRPLAPVFSIALPERPSVRPASPPPTDEPIPQFGSAEERIAPFDDFVALIAEGAGLPVRNLAERVSQLMESIEPLKHWSDDAERELRSALSASGFRIAFSRPRAACARRATLYALAELIDAGRIAEAQVAMVDAECGFYDPEFERSRPSRRDRLLVPPMGEVGIPEKWVQKIDAGLEALQREAGGQFVLAEVSKLKTLDWGTPTELRQASTGMADARGVVSASGELFGRVYFVRLASYSRSAAKEEHLVIENRAVTAETGGVRWLALNPAVAVPLGWKISPKGLFRWVDADGNTMVETIWWQDGVFEHGPPELRTEVGYGWVVLATPAGLEALRSRFGPLVRFERIVRWTGDPDAGRAREVRNRIVDV